MNSEDVRKIRVVGGKSRTKRIGKVKSCVFHPSEKRCVGFMVKRPDLLWMFHRKDLFVALDGFDLVDGRIAIKPEAETSGAAACKRMGISWDECVLWEGMPLMTADGTAVGYVGNITFNLQTGAIESVVASNGATAKYLLGTLEVPGDMLRGFKRGMGASLTVKDDSRELAEGETFTGAILVSDDVWELTPEGGWAEAAGEFTAKATERVREAAEKAKPKVQAATQAAGAAINEGAYAVGKQVAASKGMFSSFKDEFNKARAGEETDLAAVPADSKAEQAAEEPEEKGMFAAFKEEFDKANAEEAPSQEEEDASVQGDAFEAEELNEEEYAEGPGEDEYVEDADGADDEYEEDDSEYEYEEEPDQAEEPARTPSRLGMFAAFKEEFDKAKQ